MRRRSARGSSRVALRLVAALSMGAMLIHTEVIQVSAAATQVNRGTACQGATNAAIKPATVPTVRPAMRRTGVENGRRGT